MISGTCCFPQLASTDHQAEEIIQQAMNETGIPADFRKIKASSILQGGAPLDVLKESGLAADVSNIMRLPAILINNRLISFGIPGLDVLKAALIQENQ
jgi:hypothetical protein